MIFKHASKIAFAGCLAAMLMLNVNSQSSASAALSAAATKKATAKVTVQATDAVTDTTSTGDATALKYGDVVRGSIEAEGDTVAYTFTGKKGDQIILSILPDIGADKSLSQTDFKIASAGKTLYDTSKFSHYYAQGLYKLPKDGAYDVTVSRVKDASATELGSFIVHLVKPQVLVSGKAVSAEITLDQLADVRSIDDFYLINAKGALSVAFAQTDGDEHPNIELNAIDKTGKIGSNVANLSGDLLITGAVGINAVEGDVYVLELRDIYTKNGLKYTVTLTDTP